MHVSYLSEHDDAVPVLAEWFKSEWGDYFASKSQAEVEAMFRERMNRDRLPIALVGIEGKTPLGTISLAKESIETHRHLGPWIVGLYVAPEQRRKGIARSLIRAAIGEARALDIETLYIAVSKAEESYQKAGWELLERFNHDGRQMKVLKLELM